MGPAGVTATVAPLTAAERDSMAQRDAANALAQMKLAPSEQEKERLRQQNEPGLAKYGRAARLPGAPVSAPLMNGGYQVAVPVVSLPLHSSKKLVEQRKRDSIIDADNQARLRRLQDRIRARRDSIRADSLRADSLRRVVPPL